MRFSALVVFLFIGCNLLEVNDTSKYPHVNIEETGKYCNDGIDNDYNGFADNEDWKCYEKEEEN